MPTFDPNKSFKILPFNEENLKHSFYHNKVFKEKLEGEQIKYIYTYLSDLNCRIILSEFDYIDRDYLIDYANYYVRCFGEYKRKCIRNHFFNNEFNQKDFFSGLAGDEKNREKIMKGYLGFVVVKPLPETIIGRTILKTYKEDEGYGDERVYSCTRKYEPNLFGLNLTLESLAFQEQDSVAAACATSALWAAFQQTTNIFPNGLLPSPYEITAAATQHWAIERSIPNEGLTIIQMCQAIRSVNLVPDVISIEQQITPLVSLLYSYLAGKIPVILCVKTDRGYHAITLCGYKLNKNQAIPKESISSLVCKLKGLRISEFYAHDDQTGPFCKVINEFNPRPNYGKLPIKFKIPKPKGGEIEMEPFAIIVPLYHKIRIGFFDVYRYILKLNKIIENLDIGVSNNQIEWDIYLNQLNDYKNTVLEKKDLYGELLLPTVLCPLPHYIWIADAYFQGEILFEIISDATDMRRSFFFNKIIFFNDEFKQQFHQGISNEVYITKIKEIIKRSLPIYPVLHDKFIEFLGKESQ